MPGGFGPLVEVFYETFAMFGIFTLPSSLEVESDPRKEFGFFKGFNVIQHIIPSRINRILICDSSVGESMQSQARQCLGILQTGFRIFFLGAAVHAVVSMVFWQMFYVMGSNIFVAMPLTVWHGHEMVFG